MIYNRDESEVTVLGEVEKHSVSIDAKNINHIVTILSSNLYSYPMVSFLRETVSNAVDSHVEAGVNEPIIITRTKDDISIRDFGTGISPERFRDIYLNIGSSTKRETNEYIGHFGIGRFSALAVSKLANITSFYNGKAYYYVMNMDIDQLHIDKIYELDTTEHNGVEVKIPINNFDAKELDCLSFIENVYVECVDDIRNEDKIREFNNRKIHTFDGFKTITYNNRECNGKTEILLGKIPYAVDYYSLWDFDDDWHRSWKSAMEDVYPCINIGDVDITPNRETLIYSDRTKECLRNAYEKCILELTKQWNIKCDKVYDNFAEWATEIVAYRRNYLDLEGTDIELSSILPFNAKFAPHPEWDNIDPKEKKSLISTLLYTNLDILGTLTNGTIYKGRKDTNIHFKRLVEEWICDKYGRDRKVLIVPSQMGFSSKYFKDYLTAKYGGSSIIFLRKQKISSYELRSTIRRIYGATRLTDSTYLPFIVGLLKEAYRYVAKHSIYDDVMGSDEYQKYKKEHQDPKTRTVRCTSKIVFTIINTTWRSPDKYTFTIDDLLVWLRKNFKGRRVVYSSLDSPFLAAFHQISYPNLVIVSAAKNNMKYLEEGLPSYIRPIEELYVPDNRVLIKYKTADFLKRLTGVSYTYYEVMPSNIKHRLLKFYDLITSYNIDNNNGNYYGDTRSLLDIVPEGVYDHYMMGEFNELKPFLELSYSIGSSALPKYGEEACLKYYLLMKAKKIRPTYEYYKKMKEIVNETMNAL